MPVEVHVVAGKAVHALAAAFKSEKSGAFEVVFGAPKLFGGERLVAEAAKFFEHGTDKLRSGIKRGAGVNGKRAGVAIGAKFAEDRISETLTLADILEEARRHATTEDVIEDGDGEAALIRHRKSGNTEA